jgi:hypothetical protein
VWVLCSRFSTKSFDRPLSSYLRTSGNRWEHETWDINQLVSAFERIARQTELQVSYCFFIDGLDEYNGDESDVAPMLRELSASKHIKICASSRPGRIYESELRDRQCAFDIAGYTQNGMKDYVYAPLTKSKKFQELAAVEPQCKAVIHDISAFADGVWLWVYLVTRDIVYEVERNEPIGTLLKIVNDFPSDLEKYFERIIDRIYPRHKEEMAQTFLITDVSHHSP